MISILSYIKYKYARRVASNKIRRAIRSGKYRYIRILYKDGKLSSISAKERMI